LRHNLQLKFNNAPIRETVNLRIHPDQESGLSEVWFWFKDQLRMHIGESTEINVPGQPASRRF
jgi:hypothetical protein